MKSKFFVGLDIGGTKIAAGVVSPSGKILARHKISVPPKATAHDILRSINKLIIELLEEKNISRKSIAGIGCGVPGIVDPSTGRIIVTPNIGLSQFPLGAHLKKKFGTKVAVGNDVNVGILGEQWLGAGRKIRNLIGIFPGTGVGGAIIMDGRLMVGSHGAAAEIGHMILVKNGPLCGCGNRGCLEALAGRWAIERDLRKAIRSGTQSIIPKLIKNKNIIKSKTLSLALKKKDPLTHKIMRQSSEILGEACVSLRHLFDPQLFIFGGGLIEACGEFMLPIIQKKINADRFFSKLGPCKATAAKLGDDAVILGAVAFVQKS